MPRAYWHSNDWGGPRAGAGRPLEASPTRRLTVTRPEALVEALDRVAHRRSMSRSAVLAEYLAQCIEPERGAGF